MPPIPGGMRGTGIHELISYFLASALSHGVVTDFGLVMASPIPRAMTA